MFLYVYYILGDNLRATSYRVGYGNNNLRQVHHGASSMSRFRWILVLLAVGQAIQGYSRKASDPNLFTCSLIGGPDAYDNFTDQTYIYEQTEPATYNNALFITMLARLHAGQNDYNQLLLGTF